MRAFAGLQIHQVLAGVLGERLQFVQLGVVAGLEHTAVADHRGRIVDDGARQQVGQFRVGADAFRQSEQMRATRSCMPACSCGNAASAAQARRVARTGIAQADTGEDAFRVTDVLELRLQLFEAVVLEQAGDRVPRASRISRLRSGRFSQRVSRREPMAVWQRSMTDCSVFAATGR